MKKKDKIISYFRKFLEIIFSDAFKTALKKMYLNGMDLTNKIIVFLRKQDPDRLAVGFALLFLFCIIAFGLSLS